jgi:hypothetical protein
MEEENFLDLMVKEGVEFLSCLNNVLLSLETLQISIFIKPNNALNDSVNTKDLQYHFVSSPQWPIGHLEMDR